VRLFQSIFGRKEAVGRYPESLVEAAAERAVDATDSRLRLVPGYRKRLREPVVRAIDQVVALVDRIGPPVPAERSVHGTDPCLGAVFASADDMLEFLGRSATLRDFLATPEGAGAARITAAVLAQPVERNVLGMELAGDMVRREVAQVTVSFAGHRLVDPQAEEAETRRQLKRRAFDHLLTLALARIGERRLTRADLLRQRDLLVRKQKTLERGGWGFDAAQDEHPDVAALSAELDAITAELEALGADTAVLETHLGIVVEVLEAADRHLWGEDLTLFLDPMNIVRAAGDPRARRVDLLDLHNAEGRRAVLLPVSVVPADLPPREDFLTAVQRYL